MTMDDLRQLAQRLQETEAELALSKRKLQDADTSTIADRVRATLSKQLGVQMIYQKDWRDQLEKCGGEIVAYAPNVSPETMSALGLDGCGSQRSEVETRLANSFFWGFAAREEQKWLQKF